MSNINIIVGGSKGLGKKIVDVFVEEKEKCISISRTTNELKRDSVIEHKLDLMNFEEEELEEVFSQDYTYDTVVFSQRYRSNDQSIYSDEYKVQVESTARIISKLIEKLEINRQEKVCSIVIVGSTYAEGVGHDQNWGYHACKAGQYSLTKYFAVRSRGRFNINYACPATFMKEESREYWQDSEKQRIWRNYPSKKLASDTEIAIAIREITKNKSIFNNGNMIMLDGGVSHLYNDQRGKYL